jgi:hypothetical protein
VNTDRLFAVANRSGLLACVNRLGLQVPLSNLVRLTTSRRERERWRIIRNDYLSCREQLQKIAEGLISGDPVPTAWMITSMPTVFGLKLEGIMSLAARMAGFRPVGVHLNAQTWTFRYHALFGIRQFTSFQKHYYATGRRQVPPLSFMSNPSRVRTSDLIRLQYRNVDIGRIALSNVLTRHKFMRFDICSPSTLAEVASEIEEIQRNVLAAEAMFEEEKPTIAFLLEKGISPMAEVFGVCLAKGIPVIQYVGSQNMNDFVLRRYVTGNRQQHPFSLDHETWQHVQSMPWTDTQEDDMMRELAEAYISGSWFNRKFLHTDKRIKPGAEVRRELRLDASKKTAVIFSHVLWDATFFYGEGLFEDYETWLLESVRAACANPRLNWLVKLHPDLVWKLKYEGYTGELRDIIAIRSAVGTLPEHVKIVPPDTDISSYSFFEITDYAITVRGTIGIEMACHGVPVITAGTGRYSGLGFTTDSQTAQQYLERLANLDETPPMSARQIQLARRFAYSLFKGRPWKMRSFEMVRLSMDQIGHPLDHNIVPHLSSSHELSKAEDMTELANWIRSGQTDYLQPEMRFQKELTAKCVES